MVEDNPDDVRLTQFALKKEGVKNKLYLAADGEEAESFLLQAKSGGEYPIPELIILDLNLPKKNGFAVLKTIKSNPLLRTVPVIILSTSTRGEDILQSYSQHANCYIRKPSDLNDFLEVMRNIKNFWIRTAVLPNSKAS